MRSTESTISWRSSSASCSSSAPESVRRSAGPVIESRSMADQRYRARRARPDHADGGGRSPRLRSAPIVGRVPGLDDARSKGESAVEAVRVGLVGAGGRAAPARSRPEGHRRGGRASSTGSGSRSPGKVPVRTTPALDVVQRFLERSVERRPSALGSIGLNALQLLAYEHPIDGKAGHAPAAGVDRVHRPRGVHPLHRRARATRRRSTLLAEHHRAIGPDRAQPRRQGREADRRRAHAVVPVRRVGGDGRPRAGRGRRRVRCGCARACTPARRPSPPTTSSGTT